MQGWTGRAPDAPSAGYQSSVVDSSSRRSNSFETRATLPQLKLEICGKCHPFYTGRQKFVDTAGRIQRFQEKFGWTGDRVVEASKKKKQPKQAASQPAADQDDQF